MVKKIINAIKSFFGECCYGIGFIDDYDVVNPISNKPKVKWIKDVPKDRWYADPFILDVKDNVIELLAEMYKYKEAKGVLCRLEIDRATNRLIKESIILTLSTHLSFPFIHEEDNKIYVIPENYQSGTLSIYEYDRFNDSLVNPQVLINEPLVDAVCEKIGESYYIFAIKYCDDFHDAAKTLYIYRSSQLIGEYTLAQTIPYDRAEARGAGALIEVGSDYIRPSQNCQRRYGENVIFSKLHYDGTSFTIAEYGRLLPQNGRFSEGLHTYNQKCGVTVIDGVGFRRGVLSRFLNIIYQKIK